MSRETQPAAGEAPERVSAAIVAPWYGKPWAAYIDGEILRGKNGRYRRFSTEANALGYARYELRKRREPLTRQGTR